MNSIERVNNRLSGKPVDRAPNLNIIMQFAAKYIGIPYSQYCTDHRYLVDANIKCCQDFGIDMVSTISDPFREASSFGAEVIINYDDVPSCKNYLIKDYSDIKNLRPINPIDCERMNDRINAVSLYYEKVGKDYPILGWVEGAFAEACDLRGLNEMIMDIFDEPDFVNELMDITCEQAILFAKEQVNAGADFIGVGDAAASLIGPDLYKKIVMPYQRKLISSIHEMGAKVKLHICGNIEPILKYLADTGADIIDVDWMVDFRKASEAFKGKSSACGNFDPVSVLLQGDKASISNAVKSCLEQGDHYTFISAGCEVPKQTPVENLKVIFETLKG